MDQAMGDLQTQLEDTRKAWQEEAKLREKAEAELTSLKEELASTNKNKKRPNDVEETDKSDKESDATEREAKRARADA